MAMEAAGAAPDPKPLPCQLPAVPGSRISFSWGAGCQLNVVEVACPNTGEGGQQPYAGSCDWGSLAASQRRIAYQVLPLYKELQQNLMLTRGGTQEQARTARQRYSDAVFDILTAGSSDPTLGPPPNEEDLATAYEAALWQLLDFFFLSFDDLEAGCFPEAFAGWMLQHGGLFDADTQGFSQLHAQVDQLLQDPRVDTNTAYWGTVQHLVVLGQLETAMRLLAHHPVFQASQEEGMANLARGFEEVFQLLRTAPRLGRVPGASSALMCGGGCLMDDAVRFADERQQWEASVSELYHARNELLDELKESNPAAAKGLAGVLLMLCPDFRNSHPGESAAAKQMAKVCWNWVELLVGMLLWQYRELPLFKLKFLVEEAVSMMVQRTRHTDRDFLDFFEQILLAACQQEVQEVVCVCTNSTYTSLQFVVHSFEVLKALPEAARVIARPLPHVGCDQAESFMLNYVEVLAGAAATWPLAAEYLAWCRVYGADALEALLDQSPHVVRDQQSALKALALARTHDLTAAAYSLCKRLAAVASRSGQLAAAMQWALQAHDAQLCAELVAPLVVKIQQQLLAQANSFQAAPLELPELQDLEPLLLSLPDSAVADIQPAAEDAQQQPQPASAARLQRYPELHFLRAMLQLQQALQAVKSCQQPQASDQELPGSKGSRGLLREELSQQQAAALQAAYSGVRRPVQELLLDGLAPAALQLPLLLHVAPLLESAYMPFSRLDVAGLQRVMRSVTAGLPTEAAAVLDGSHGGLPGVAWPVQLSDKAGPDAAAVNAARLALCRGLARAHVMGSRVQAW